MKRLKRIGSLLLLALILSVSVPIPSTGNIISVDAATIKISKTSLSLIAGNTTTLKITGTTKKVKWSSSKKSIVTVSTKGTVTAKSVGSTTITASVSGKKYTCKVTVSPKQYAEGQYKVGKDIKAGEYVVFATKDKAGYFSLTKDANGDDIISNDNFDYNTIIYIKNGEYLELSRAYAVAITDVKKLTTTGTGMFKIGVFLPSGEYKLSADKNESGYYCIYADNRHDKIVSNDNFKGTSYVTVEEGQYLELSRCKIVQ